MGGFFSSLFPSSSLDDNWKSDAEFAMESSWFCVLCGAPLDLTGDVHSVDISDERFNWIMKYRLLGDVDNPQLHCINVLTQEELASINLINESGSEDVFLSEKAWFNYTGSMFFRLRDRRPGGGELWLNALEYIPNHGTLFPVHEACIAVSEAVITKFRAKREGLSELSNLAILNQMLQSRFSKTRTVGRTFYQNCANNDLLDLCSSSETWGPRSVVALTLIEWWRGEFERFYSDPLNIPDLTSFVAGMLQSSPRKADNYLRNYRFSREPKGLERLPVELLEIVSDYLPIESVLSLHRTSKTLALLVPLGDSFCRKQLMNGTLHLHIWDLDTAELQKQQNESQGTYWDWRSAARLLTPNGFSIKDRDPRLSKLPDGLWNRGRIWTILEEALHEDYPNTSTKKCEKRTADVRTKRQPVTAGDMEAMLDDMGHWW